MPPFAESYASIVAALAQRYGHPDRVAASADVFEQIIAAVLSRSFDRRRVEGVMGGLRESGLLDATTLAAADSHEVAEAARSAGAGPNAQVINLIQRLARWIVECHHGSADELQEFATARLRAELLGLKGVGAPTADAILLFALRRPVYPVDRSSYRVLVRHGWIDPDAGYDEARDMVERLGPDDPDALARLSGWLERVGRDACRPSVAKCQRCPLEPWLPPGGPCEPDRY